MDERGGGKKGGRSKREMGGSIISVNSRLCRLGVKREAEKLNEREENSVKRVSTKCKFSCPQIMEKKGEFTEIWITEQSRDGDLLDQRNLRRKRKESKKDH